MRFVLIVCSGNQLNSRMYTFSFDGIVNTSLFHEVDLWTKCSTCFFVVPSFLRFVMSLWFFVSRCRAVLSSFRDVTVCFVWPFVSFLGCFVSSLRFAVIDRARLGMSQGTLHDETTSQSFWFQVNFTLLNRKSECLSSFEMSNISPHGHKTVPTGHRMNSTQFICRIAFEVNNKNVRFYLNLCHGISEKLTDLFWDTFMMYAFWRNIHHVTLIMTDCHKGFKTFIVSDILTFSG